MRLTLRERTMIHTALKIAAEIRRHRFGKGDPVAIEYALLAERIDIARKKKRAKGPVTT